MRAGFYTLGCKLNQYESEALASSFKSRGFFIVSIKEQAEIYIINTCTVTSKAEQKARRIIRKVSKEHPGSAVIVTGCYAQLNGPDIEKLGKNVSVVSQIKKDILLDLPQRLDSAQSYDFNDHGFIENIINRIPFSTDTGYRKFRYTVSSFSFHSRAFLKIQDGCNNSCAYCRVPLARGKSVSLDSSKVVSRVEDLIRNGYREIVLTGVNITSYKDSSMELYDLLKKVLENCKNTRLRLSSLEPERINIKLAEVLSSDRICPHFHIPVQSGSDKILKAMKRLYNTNTLYTVVSLLRDAKKDPFIAADVIAGFPGETEDDFKRTKETINKLNLSQLHVFPFSPRPGTAAYNTLNRVPDCVIKDRVSELRSISKELYKDYASHWNGKCIQAVMEKENESDNSVWSGLSENYLNTSISGVPSGLNRGRLCLAKVVNTKETVQSEFIRYV